MMEAHKIRDWRLLSVILLFAGAMLLRVAPSRAEIAPSPCANNVCTGQIVVGAQTVNYSYTQHLSSNGTLKIRLNGGLYDTSQLISYIIYDTPPFTAWDKYANPTNAAVFLPEEDVNPGRTAYERKDSDGCSNCIVDQVMTMRFSGLAAGHYAFSVQIIQNGANGGLAAIPFYVDAAAPENTNESVAWSSVPHPQGTDLPCADGVDNDLSYYADCADSQCVGSAGRVSDGALCEATETTCDDGFDNNANGKVDCADQDCDGRLGRQTPAALCQYGNEFGSISCGDGFDNDSDGIADCLDNASTDDNASHTCWKQTAYNCPATETSCTDGVDNDKDKSYDSAYDAAPLTGADCKDYDCAGNAACPAKENQLADGTEADAQCFNGIDDDLDHLVDCADPDCLGAVNPASPSQTCTEKEFDLGQRYQFCANAIDDNSNGPKDCADPDCSRKFGNCGPCPSREDYTYDACADNKDNDNDATVDCADTDCTAGYPKLGTLGNAAYCAASEDTAPLCADGFDNDKNGKIDCADAGCNGISRCSDASCSHTYVCQTNEASCGDGFDNDGNGFADCVDPGCAGVGSCAPKNWANAACQVVPRLSALAAFTGSDPTILAQSYVATHVDADDIVHFTGTLASGGTYQSVTIIIGDNTDASQYYPYSSAAGCALSGADAGKFAFTAIDGHAVQIFNRDGVTASSFDINLTCATPSVPAAAKTYPISISALKEPGDHPEYGDVSFSTTLYEGIAPTVTAVESEGDLLVGGTPTITVPYGGMRHWRTVPNDPGTGLGTSGICSCTTRINGQEYLSPDGGCVTPAIPILSDFSALSLQGKAEDGAGNAGGFSATQTVNVNVTPATTSALVMTSPPKPFFKTGYEQVGVFAEFTTATGSTFGASCDVLLRTPDGTLVGPGPIATAPAQTIGNFVRCEGTVAIPASAITDGEYFLSVQVQDSAGDIGESNRKASYVCNALTAGTVCEKADFDYDGATEGLFTTLYSTAPKACDNCPNLANDQTDTNADGVGDVCEPSDVFGRCEIDRDLVCQCNSDAPGSCTGPRCPGPSIADIPGSDPPAKKDPQNCNDTWGLCTLGGEICFVDAECPGGPGVCSGDGATSCRRDLDCIDVGGTCVGADRCENLLFPWLEVIGGNVFSKKKITAADVPPHGRFNATYCITAKDTILNFVSELCSAVKDANTRYERPKPENAYSTVLGRIDEGGLVAGRYGTVVHTTSAEFASVFNSAPLEGRVYVVDASAGDLVLADPIIVANAVGSGRGNGTVVVEGGNLRIHANIGYDASPISSLKQLGSIGWLVLPNANGDNGNIYVGGTVTDIAGAFFAGGSAGIFTVEPPDTDSPQPLTVSGIMVARKFQLSRSYKSTTRGSEQILFDGRAVANPPPGLADVSKSLPRFSDAPPQ